MLFLYRIQNDPLETSSFNALELEGAHSLGAFAAALNDILGCDVRNDFSWRARKQDPHFGLVWRDIRANKDFEQELEADILFVKLLRLGTLSVSRDRVPIKFVGQSTVKHSTQSEHSTKPERIQTKRSAETSKKRPTPPPLSAQEPLPRRVQSFPAKLDPNMPLPNDGLSTEDRARRRVEIREEAERQAQASRVKALQDAHEENLSRQNERFKAWEELQSKLENWSGPEANPKPIRALLSTLHNILWQDAKWSPVTVLVRPNEVRLAYRKAMLVVHSDKVNTTSAHVEVIAKYAFESLNKAYEKFEATELRG